MKKLVAAALFALAAGAASSAHAEPLIIIENWPSFGFNGGGGQAGAVGDAFTPFAKVADVREECEAAGGIAKRRLDDAGQLVWVCVK